MGTALRFALGRAAVALGFLSFPWGTLAANLSGCFLIGFVGGLADRAGVVSPAARLFFMVGFCGGLTTFSSFAGESLAMLRGGQALLPAFYIGGSVAAGVLSVYAGAKLAGML